MDFATRLRVRFSDTDAMGIAHHSNYFRFFEVARTDWIKQKGYDYRMFEHDGFHLALISASAQFKKPTRFDDEIEIRIKAQVDGLRVFFEYEVHMVDAGPKGQVKPGALLATGETVHVTVDKNMRPARLPQNIVELFS